jgi:hypothetical protein
MLPYIFLQLINKWTWKRGADWKESYLFSLDAIGLRASGDHWHYRFVGKLREREYLVFNPQFRPD